MQSNEETTILVSTSEKRRLDKRKLHPREPYRDVVKRVLDEVDRYESDKTSQGTQIEMVDQVESQLAKIVKGRLAKWSTSDRSHEKILLSEVAKPND